MKKQKQPYTKKPVSKNPELLYKEIVEKQNKIKIIRNENGEAIGVEGLAIKK